MTTEPDAEQLRRDLQRLLGARLDSLSVYPQIDSTNSELQRLGAAQPGHYRVCLATGQTAGRGRRGRRWHAPPGACLCLSVATSFEGTVPVSLTLGVGCALAVLLKGAGVTGIGLKWPNDLLIGQRKLGGILTEVQQSAGISYAIVGVGLNLQVSPQQQQTIADDGGLEAVGLVEPAPQLVADIDRLCVLLAGQVVQVLDRYHDGRSDDWRAEWKHFDVLADASVEVMTPTGKLAGTVTGVDDNGALLLANASGVHRLYAGEVSVRQR